MRIAVVGPCGSGKSTLIDLATRIHDPPPGTVFLDGRDIRELKLDELRRQFAVAPQEAFLFSETIHHNILSEANGHVRTVEAAAQTAATELGLAPFQPQARVVDDASLRRALGEVRHAGSHVLVVMQPAIGDGRLAALLAAEGEVERAEPRVASFQVDLNRAPWPELIQLPGIGPTLARRIVESRQTEGPFTKHEDIERVHGIGPKKLEAVRPYLCPIQPRGEGRGEKIVSLPPVPSLQSRATSPEPRPCLLRRK